MAATRFIVGMVETLRSFQEYWEVIPEKGVQISSWPQAPTAGAFVMDDKHSSRRENHRFIISWKLGGGNTFGWCASRMTLLNQPYPPDQSNPPKIEQHYIQLHFELNYISHKQAGLAPSSKGMLEVYLPIVVKLHGREVIKHPLLKIKFTNETSPFSGRSITRSSFS